MRRDFLHVMLIRASASHKKRSRQSFQRLNLTEGQPKVLSILRGMEGCQQKELAKACRVEPATMTSLLRNMEQSDLVTRRNVQTATGKRANSIFLTDHGRELACEVMNIIEELELKAFQNFSSEEKETFLQLFAKVTENLEENMQE